MFELRDGKVWVASGQQLVEERPGLEVGALAVRIAAGEAAPDVRAFLDFVLMVGGAAHGPYRAEVVHRAGAMLGLHLSGEAVKGLLAVCDGLESCATRPALGRETLESAAVEAELPAAAATTERTLEVGGELAGSLGPGVLVDLLETSTVPPPATRTTGIRLFRYLAGERATGRLVIRGTTHVKSVLFQHGVILRVDVDPPKEDEMLGQILLKARWISPQQLAGALRWGRSDGSQLGSTMVRTGLLEEKKLARALAHQNYRRLRDLFDWQGARFWFEQPADLSGNQTPLSIDRLMAELALDVLRDVTLDHLALLVQHQNDRYPSLDLGMTPDRFRVLVPEEKTRRVCEQIFDGSRLLRLAIQSSVLGRQRTTCLVLYLQAAGVLRMTRDALRQDLTPAQQLSEHLRTLQVQDAFQRLGLRYHAHPDEIDAAHRSACVAFAPTAQLYRASPQSADKGVALLNEARSMLEHRASRCKYRQKAIGVTGLAYLKGLVEEELLLAELHGDEDRRRRLRDVLQELQPS